MTCHIVIPQVEGKRVAVVVDGCYFRSFRRFNSAQQVMAVAKKLAHQGRNLALTPSNDGNDKGYRVWIQAPEVEKVITEALDGPLRLPTYGPSPCFMIADRSYYRTCYVKVPDLFRPLVAIYHAQRFYSVYRKDLSPAAALELATKLAGRGDEVAIAPANQAYAVCIFEPEAIPYQPSKPQ